MGPLSKYWEIVRIDPGGNGSGYKKQALPPASEFFSAEFAELLAARSQSLLQQHRSVQVLLHNQFTTDDSVDLQNQYKAGLCLRSYVSHAIVDACKVLASRFSHTGQLTYRDLLPYVLNDDGKLQIVLDRDEKVQLIINHNGQPDPSVYQLFAVEVLCKFNPQGQRASSLNNWVHLQIRQHPDIQEFLSQQGFHKLTDWALLNRVGANQLKTLSERERHIVEGYHAVYRRDRRQPQQNHRKCPDPSPAQLQEIQQYLQAQEITFQSLESLQIELKRLAQSFRQYALWSQNGMPPSDSLDAVDPHYGSPKELGDPNAINDLDQIAQRELGEFCRQQLTECLDWGINKGISEHITNLEKRPRYAVFAPKVATILQLVYCQGQSQRQIATTLGMTNQSQVSRVLNPTALANRVRYWTVKQFLQILLDQVSNLNLVPLPIAPDYLNNLLQPIEDFFDEEVFQAAVAEIKTARNQPMASLYAQRLRHYIEKL